MLHLHLEYFVLQAEEYLSTIDSGDNESENKPGIGKILSSKAETWMGKKGIVWPWKERGGIF